VVPQLKLESEEVKVAPVPRGVPDESVVVAVSPPDRFAEVPQAKPRTAAPAAPISVTVPLRVAEVCEGDEAACVLAVGPGVALPRYSQIYEVSVLEPAHQPVELLAHISAFIRASYGQGQSGVEVREPFWY